MSVTTRTQRATNPKCAVNATGYAAVPGTGGTASGARNTGTGYTGAAGFYRVSWTAATTAVSGGASYTQTGLSATTQYSMAAVVRSSKTQTVNLSAQYQDSSSVNVGSAVTSSNMALTANVWSDPIVINGATSGAAVDRVVLTAQAVTGGSNWANGDTFDVGFVLVETGATAGGLYDGDTVDAGNVIYAWTGSANASNSTATTYVPVITTLAKTDAPCPRVEVTITDLTPTENVVTVWRTSDGKRQAVRGARKRTTIGSDFFIDYEAPLMRSLGYDLEILSGVNALAAVTTSTVSVFSDTGWIQDPLIPSSAIPIVGDISEDGSPALRGKALQEFEYAADVNLVGILGSPEPVALIGQRMAAGNVDFSVVTEVAQKTTDLRNLIQDSGLLLVRPVPPWGAALPGLCYIASKAPVELPQTVYWGGEVTNWEIKTNLVAAPTMNVLVPIWTYGDVAALWTTYQQAQTALTGKTYLEVLKSPSGA